MSFNFLPIKPFRAGKILLRGTVEAAAANSSINVH